MKFLIEKSQIVKILSKIQGLTGKNSNLAITENVLLEANNGHIIIKATDLETGFEGHYPGKIETTGSLAVNAKKLYEILKVFPDSDIFVEEIKNSKLRVRNNNICYDIVGNSPKEFPEITGINEGTFLKIEASIFRNMIKRTIIISSKAGEKRAHITGVLLEIDSEGNNDVLRMVSTDANRLSVVNHVLDEKIEVQSQEKFLIPKKGLSEVIKFIDNDGSLDLGIQNNVLIVKKENETVIVRLLEGEFPDYKEIVNKKNNSVIELSRYHFGNTLKRMSILTSERNNGVIFLFNDNKMIVTAKNPEYGESKEEVEIRFSEKRIEAAFNPKYILDTLSVMKGESVYINILDEKQPCIIESSDNDSFISVIMPMRV